MLPGTDKPKDLAGTNCPDLSCSAASLARKIAMRSTARVRDRRSINEGSIVFRLVSELGDEVHIHQAVAEDGVAEGEGQQGQRQRGDLHGCAGQRTHQVRDYVK